MDKKLLDKYNSLIEKIQKYDYHYYVLAESLISDKEYDLLFKELESIEKEYPEIKRADSPTEKVGGQPIDGFETIDHKKQMLSLQNTYSREEVEDFYRKCVDELGTDKIKFNVELKFDGVAISLHYKNSLLDLALTRGDGTKGDNVINNAKRIKAIPLKSNPIKYNDVELKDFEVRGEVFMLNSNFKKLNQKREEEGLPLYANPRNTTAGTLKLLDPKEVFNRKLQISLYYLDSDQVKFDSQFQNYQILKDLGFPTSEYIKLCNNIDEIFEFIDYWNKRRDDLDFEIDGIVIKVDSINQQKELGQISRSPKWAIAYKYDAEKAETKINDISLQIGRQGTITPVAELEPVLLSGTTVKRASLYNMDYITEKDIRIGDYVLIEKGGEIIPKVTEVVFEKRNPNSMAFEFPEEIDGIKISRKEGEANYYLDTSANNKTILKKSIEHFASRDAMDIENLGEKIISYLVENNYLHNISEIFILHTFADELKKKDGFGDKSVENLISSIEKSKTQNLHRFIYGLGIRHIGLGASKILSKNFKDLEQLSKANYEQLIGIFEIGEKMAISLVSWFSNVENISLIQKFKEYGVNPEKEESEGQISDELLGKTFVFTGELETLSRKEAADKIELMGAKETKSVSKKTDFVVAGKDAGSKLQKARDLGIKILDEKEFLLFFAKA